MLSDDRLAELIPMMDGRPLTTLLFTDYYDIKHIRDALTELQEARKLLRAVLPHIRTCSGPTHHEDCACSVKRRIEAIIAAEREDGE